MVGLFALLNIINLTVPVEVVPSVRTRLFYAFKIGYYTVYLNV